MKKWEEQQNRKMHEKKIMGAKSTFSTKNSTKNSVNFASPPSNKGQFSSAYSVSSQSPQQNTASDLSRVSQNSKISDYFEFEKQDLTQIPLYRLLKHYSLQQYAKGLISRGFGYDLSKFASLGRDELDKLLEDIKMLPGHKVKLMKLASQVTQICHELMEQDDLKQFKQSFYNNQITHEMSKPKTATVIRNQTATKFDVKKNMPKKPATSIGIKKVPAKSTQSTAKKPTSAVKKQNAAKKKFGTSTKKLERIGFDFFSDSQQSMDDEFSQVLDSILNRYQDQFIQSGFQEKPIFSNSRKERTANELLRRMNYSDEEDLKLNLQKVINDISSHEQDESTHANEIIAKEGDTSTYDIGSDTRGNTSPPYDEIESASKTSSKKEVSHFREYDLEKPKSVKAGLEARSKILELLDKKLDEKHLNKDELNVEFRKIKDMYSSFEGAKMTSTIANLDIEEMSYCLACAIQKHVDYFIQCILPNGDFSMPSFMKDDLLKKEFEISQLRYNYNRQRTFDESKPITESQLRQEYEKEEYVAQEENQEEERKQQGEIPEEEGIEVEENKQQPIEEEELATNQDLGDNCVVYHKEEDDEVMHTDSMGAIEEEEEKIDDDLEHMQDVNFQMEPGTRMYFAPLDPYIRSTLDIISERSYETSQNTVKMHEAVKNMQEDMVNTEEQIEEEGNGNAPENKGEIEDFLRESLRDSLMLNLKHEKQQDRKSAGEPQETDPGSLKGFSMKINPTQENYYISESVDLRSQVNEGGNNNMAHMRQSDMGLKGEVLFSRDKDWGDISMEESLYSELPLDNQNMDIAQRIRYVFEKTFSERNMSQEDYNKRIKDTIDKNSASNFCKNIVITTKMEKEVVILSLVYIERLIVRTNMYVNAINWKRITFAALILASKIWDDESFENANFAKAFPQYTTKEINEIERVFLEFLDYDLMINGSEYAKYYFILRTFAEKNKKSFPLKALNLQTVRLLQKRAAATSKTLKEHYLEPLNKTFS